MINLSLHDQKTCAQIAALSYIEERGNLIKAVNRVALFIEYIDIQDTQAIICEINGKILVTFRGVELDRFLDIRSALNFRTKLQTYGDIHSGFDDALSHVWPILLGFLPNNLELIFNGHSMGGALAQIASYKYFLKCGEMLPTITFGAPKIGRFKKLIPATPLYKFNLIGDPIPFLPLNWMGPYKEKSRHGFHLLYPDGRIKVQPPFLLHKVLTLRALLKNPLNAPGLAWQRHSAMSYLKALTNATTHI
jgi:lipase (class 3)